MKRFFCSLMVMFIFAEQIFACGGCRDAGRGFSLSNSSIQNFLQEETRTATEILKEGIIIAQTMAIEKSNNNSFENIKKIEKEIYSLTKKEIFLLELNNKLEGSNINTKYSK